MMAYVCNPSTEEVMQEDYLFKASLDYIVSLGQPGLYETVEKIQNTKQIKVKSSAGKIHFSGNVAMLPVIRQEKPHKPFTTFLTMVAGSPEPKSSNTITILPLVPGTNVSILSLVLLLLLTL